MSVIRINKTDNYSVLSNRHLRDKRLSLKAKGLLSIMLSLPDNWNYSISGIATLCCEKENNTNTISKILSELKEFKYLKVEKKSPKNTASGRYEYEYQIYEQPYDEIVQSNISKFDAKPLTEKQDLEKQDLEKQDLEKQDLEKQDLEKQDLEKQDLEIEGININTNIINTNILNTELLNTKNTELSDTNVSNNSNPTRSDSDTKSKYLIFKSVQNSLNNELSLENLKTKLVSSSKIYSIDLEKKKEVKGSAMMLALQNQINLAIKNDVIKLKLLNWVKVLYSNNKKISLEQLNIALDKLKHIQEKFNTDETLKIIEDATLCGYVNFDWCIKEKDKSSKLIHNAEHDDLGKVSTENRNERLKNEMEENKKLYGVY